MKRTPTQYASALLSAAQEAKDLDSLIIRFRALLRRDKAVKLLPRIVQAAARLNRQAKGETLVEVTTARSAAGHKLIDLLRPAFGPVELVQREDPALIGGAVIRAEDTLIDGSVRTMLKSLGRASAISTNNPINQSKTS